jgi:hypothetical protein
MNRIRRIAAIAAVSTAVLTAVTAAVASAEPTDPACQGWCPYAAPSALRQDRTEQLLRQEQQQYMQQPVDEQPPLRQEQQYMQQQKWGEPADEALVDDATTGLSPWEAVGLAALGAGVVAGGGVVFVRRYHHEPRPA